jgi:hypothetical protein
MALVIGEAGVLRDAVVRALTPQGDVAVTTIEDDDLVSAACGQEAVVYLAGAGLVDAALSPAPSAERARDALRAAHAPGVSLIVAVLPEGDAYREEIDVIERDGTPYVVVEAPPLLEELAGTLYDGVTLFVPSEGAVRATDAAGVAAAVRDALVTEEQGRIVSVAVGPLAPKALLRRAAELGSRRVRVISLWKPLYRLARWIGKLFRRRAPVPVVLCERLALPVALSET